MKKAIALTLLCALTGVAFASPRWKNLTDKAWVSGPKCREADLVGNVVFVFYWQPDHENLDAILPRVEALWDAYKAKHCAFVSSVSGNLEDARKLINEHKLSFPVYEKLDTADAQSPTRFGFRVLNVHGKVLYGNKSDREATEALVDALGEAGKPFSLLGSVELGKKSKYRSLEKSLVLGKPVKNIAKKLRADIKKAEAKSATDAIKEQASDAEAILSALDGAKTAIKEEIESLADYHAARSVKLAKQYCVSFPEEAAEMKAKIPEWNAKAKEQAKAAAEAKKESAHRK